MDVFLWGSMKQLAYSSLVESEMDQVARVAVKSATIQDDARVFLSRSTTNDE